MQINKSTLFLKCLILVFVLISNGCQSKSNNPNLDNPLEKQVVQKDEFFSIDVPELLKHKQKVNVSEIATSIEYIPLETTPNSLLGRISDAVITKDYIFIKHRGSPLLTQFSRDGKYIRKIGIEGRGPKEYARMRKFSIDEQNELIYIHTNWTRKILTFTFDGDYVKSIDLKGNDIFCCTWSHDSALVSFQEPNIGNEKYVFLETSFNGDTIQGISNHIFWPSDESSQRMIDYSSRNSSYRANNKLHLKGWYNDTVYTYNSENKIVPKYIVDLKNYKIPDTQIPTRKSSKPLPEKCYWTGVNESANYIFINYGEHLSYPDSEEKGHGLILFDKKTRIGTALINKNKNEYGFKNNLDAGPEFIPTFSNHNIAYCFITALDFKEHFNSGKFDKNAASNQSKKEELKQLNNTLKYDDNHILMVINLKP